MKVNCGGCELGDFLRNPEGAGLFIYHEVLDDFRSGSSLSRRVLPSSRSISNPRGLLDDLPSAWFLIDPRKKYVLHISIALILPLAQDKFKSRS